VDFVKLSLDVNYGNYDYCEASNEEMGTLGLFLIDDVGCSRGGSPTLAEWAFQDRWGTGFSGNATRVEKEGEFIFLSDVFPEEENPTKLKMTRQQFVDIVDEWFNKVCLHKPKEVIVKYIDNQFFIETCN
jgi:hypothetical protein